MLRISDGVFARSSACHGGACVEVAWFRSSKCSGGDCVEVSYRTSSRSGIGGECVEVGRCDCDEIRVRDSKNVDGPVLVFTKSEWEAFVEGAKAGEFDLPIR